MIPSYGESLIEDEKLMRKIRKQTSKDLELGYYKVQILIAIFKIGQLRNLIDFSAVRFFRVIYNTYGKINFNQKDSYTMPLKHMYESF